MKFMPDPLTRQEFETLEQVGVLPVKWRLPTVARNDWSCWGLPRKFLVVSQFEFVGP
jgi:hypothetical protein